MRATPSFVLALALAAPAAAQDPAPSPEPPASQAVPPAPGGEKADTGQPEPAAPANVAAAEEAAVEAPQVRLIDFGLSGVETDTRSSKFREYRSAPTGIVLPFVRFAGGQDIRYDVRAWNVLQDDALYQASAERGSIALDASYHKIPHRFGNDARSLLEDTGRGVLTLSDTLQQSFQGAIERQFAQNRAGVNFAFLNGLVQPSLQAEDGFDIDLLRERGHATLGLAGGGPLDVRLSYFHERRRGTRGSGTAFGFGNVVETPEPIDYRTQDVNLSAEWGADWGLVRGALNFNEFTNSIAVQTFDNPFRAVSSTDASAYLGPASSSIGGASFARLALPPDNRAVTGSLGLLWKLSRTSRLSVDASLGQWTQDDQFIPFTSNVAIQAPFDATNTANLPRQSLDGKIDVFSFSSSFSTRPTDRLNLTARVRRYDLSNDTPRIPFEEGYVRFDAVFEEIPRISVPYGYTNDQLQGTASYDLGKATVEGGYRFERMDRTFRETEETTQNTVFGSVLVRPSGWAVLRATVERASRDFDEYHPDESEHASFLNPGPATNQPLLRRFDQAKKDTTRVVSQLQLNPWGPVTLALSYLRAKDDYEELSHGLIEAENEAISVEADYTPNARWSLFAFYTREDIATFQRGRQSGATPSANPLDDWTSEIDDEVDTYGGGANLDVWQDRLELRVIGSYQKIDGNNDLESPPGGSPDVAFDIAQFDDTKLLTLNAELAYRVGGGLRVIFGGWFEDYEIRDAFSTGLPFYTPGGFFLAGNDGDYRAHVLYARASYSW